MELYQAEWCPHSHKVRQRLTELGLDVTVRQGPAEPAEGGEMEAKTGANEIRRLVDVRVSRIELEPDRDGFRLRVGEAVRARAARRFESDKPVACGIPGYD